MPTTINRDGVNYRRTTVDIKEDLHTWAKTSKVNITALVNACLEKKMKEKK